MTDGPTVLLTNDDGIDSPGIRAMYETLTSIADVTVVAPVEDCSAIGRATSRSGSLSAHELGYAVDGTPVDCVLAGLSVLESDPDAVVAGCNKGANIGAHVLGRSGTVSAAVEAAFNGVPAIATSMYVPVTDRPFDAIETTTVDYREATRATAFLLERALEGGVFAHADYLNVNAPAPDDGPSDIEVTTPSPTYEVRASVDAVEPMVDGGKPDRNVDALESTDARNRHADASFSTDELDRRTESIEFVLEDRSWERLRTGSIPDPPGTDRRAIHEGRISVSALSTPSTPVEPTVIEPLSGEYEPFVAEFGHQDESR